MESIPKDRSVKRVSARNRGGADPMRLGHRNNSSFHQCLYFTRRYMKSAMRIGTIIDIHFENPFDDLIFWMMP